MSTLARLVVKLITDVSEFEAGMKNAATKLDRIGQSMSRVGDTLTAGVTLPILAAGAAAIKFASDQEESLNKVRVVFGEHAGDVEAALKNSATAMGMSNQAALEAAGSFGTLFSAMGLTGDESVRMSTDLVQLASDIASFNNLSMDEALQKLRSGLVGEAEPMRQVGVLLNETAVKAKAAEMGLTGAGGALSEQAKVLARYAIIMEQTALQQGDFARTSDGLANSTRILQAQFTDMLASFGRELIPAAISFMQAAIPILQWFTNLPEPIKKAIINMLLFAATVGPILSVGGRLISLGSNLMGLFGKTGFLAKAAGLAAKLVPALGAIPGVLSSIGAAFAAMGLPILALVLAIGVLIVTIKLFGKQAWETIKMIGAIFGMLPKYIEVQVLPAFRKLGTQLVNGLRNGIASGWSSFVKWLQRIFGDVVAWAKKVLGIHSPSAVFAGIGENMMLGLEKGIDQASSRPINATVQAMGTSANVGAIKAGGGGRAISVGPITINGDLSSSAKENLRREMEEMFNGLIAEAFA